MRQRFNCRKEKIMPLIKYAICDDNAHFITCLKLDSAANNKLEFTGEAHSASECMDMIENSVPDILLLDIQMETPTAGIDLIPQIKEKFPKLKIIMLTVSEAENDVFFALKNGADGYILKNTPNMQILENLENIYENNFSIENSIMQKYISYSKTIENSYKSLLFFCNLISQLTKSELEILKSLCENKSYSQIAKERFTAENTVRTLASRIVKKFNVDNIKSLVDNVNKLNIFDNFDV